MITLRILLFFVLVLNSLPNAKCIDELMPNKVDDYEPVMNTIKQFPFRMPSVRPNHNDMYICLEVKVESAMYITNVIADLNNDNVHHILLFGLENSRFNSTKIPEKNDFLSKMNGQSLPWECSPSFGGNAQGGNAQLVYGWSKMTYSPEIPEGYGIKIGGDTNIKYLAINVHYSEVDKFINGSNLRDNSGVIVSYLPENNSIVKRQWGILSIVGVDTPIDKMSSKNIELVCPINQEDVHIVPEMFSIHTHHSGVSVEGYKVSRNETDEAKFIWQLIGKGDPQTMKASQPIFKSREQISSSIIKNEDFIAVKCVMENNLSHPIPFGLRDDEEMCYFYLYYSVGLNESLLKNKACAPNPKNSWLDTFKSLPLEDKNEK